MNIHLVRSRSHPTIIFAVILLTFLCNSLAIGQQSSILLQNQRELFIDDFILETIENAEVRLASPVPQGPVMKFSKPWEGQFCAYVSMVNDGQFFHMYYRGVTGYENKGDQEVTCYAISADGVHWRKPKLGLFEVNGIWENNVVMHDNPQSSTHNFTVLYDDREGVPREERFKAVGGHSISGELYRYVSENGIHWNRFQDTTILFSNRESFLKEYVLRIYQSDISG